MVKSSSFVDNLLVYALLILIPGSIVLATVWYNVSTVLEWRRVTELQRVGVRTMGSIVNKSEFSSLKTSTTYQAEFVYTLPNGQPQRVSRTIDGNLYRLIALAPNAPRTVLYFANRPEEADLEGNKGYESMVMLAVLLDLALIALTVGIFYMAKQSPTMK
jgi:hypothetical protein